MYGQGATAIVITEVRLGKWGRRDPHDTRNCLDRECSAIPLSTKFIAKADLPQAMSLGPGPVPRRGLFLMN